MVGGCAFQESVVSDVQRSENRTDSGGRKENALQKAERLAEEALIKHGQHVLQGFLRYPNSSPHIFTCLQHP